MKSSAGQLREFKESFIWMDMIDEIDVWLEMIRDNLENADMSMEHRMLDRLGGCAEAVRNFRMIVEVLIDSAEDSSDRRDTILNNLIKRR